MPISKEVIESFFPGSHSLGLSPVDGTVAFYNGVNTVCPENAVVLDYGAGDGSSITAAQGWKRHLLTIPKASKRIGVDADPGIKNNPFLAGAYLLKSEDHWRAPIQDGSIDLVVCDWVVEHLPDPVIAFTDIYRVLRPGGWFCCRTGNLWHYTYALANLVKDTHWERRLLGMAQGDRKTWPKMYRANTKTSLRQSLLKAGFATSTLVAYEPEPAYMMRNIGLFVLGMGWQRLATIGILPKSTLLIFARK